MCTVAIVVDADGTVFVAGNRDESVARKPASPPERVALDGVAYLAPRDGAEGGTWTAVNEHGVALSLLNNYQGGHRPPPADPVSRGHIVRSVARCASVDEVVATVSDPERLGHDLRHVRPFVLVAVDRRRAASVRWAGDGVVEERLELPAVVVSNGGDLPRAERERGAAFRAARAEHGDDVEALFDAFFGGHRPVKGHYSVCMHLPPFAGTVSHTRICMGAAMATMRYTPGPPCTPTGSSTTAQLPLPRGELPL